MDASLHPMGESLLRNRMASQYNPTKLLLITNKMGFFGSLAVKNPPVNEGDVTDLGLMPGLGRSPGGGHGNPFQCPCLENPRDRGDSQVSYSPWGRRELDMTEMTQHACRHSIFLFTTSGNSTPAGFLHKSASQIVGAAMARRWRREFLCRIALKTETA